MTLTKVSRGQPLRMTAEAFNAFVDAAQAHQAGGQGFGAAGTALTRQAGIVPVRNDSGVDQDRFAILGIDDVLITPGDNLAAFQERVSFSAILPDADVHAQRFCILQDPIAAGSLGRALIAGITPARLAVQADDDAVAAVVTGDSARLETGSDGGARILWKESGVGDRWAVVQIPAGGSAGGDPNLVLQVTQVGHGWLVGDVLRWNGGAWDLADAAVTGDGDELAVVGRIPDADAALLVLWGICCLDGLAAHTDYWLDPAVPGTLTPTKPGTDARLILHHAQDRLCVVRPGGGSSSAQRFADLTDVDLSTPPSDGQAAIWDDTSQRWIPHDVILADPVPAHQVLAGPTAGADATPAFRDPEVGDLAEVPPTSVLVNATNAAARPTALAAAADDRVLIRVAGTLQWLQVPGAAIADGAITDPKIVSVSWAKVTGTPAAFPPAAHDHLLGGDLQGTTANAQIRADAVGTPEIADAAVTDGKILSLSWFKLTGVPATFPPSAHDHALGGDLTGTTANAQIALGAVGTPEIANGAVTNAKLQMDFLRVGTTDFHLGDTVTGIMTNPMTSVGDLIVGGAAGAPTRLAVNPGGTLQILTSKSGVTALVSHTLDALEDVTVAAPLDKQVLAYDAATS
ncbi:MAG: hypothetical protein H0V44_09590, partial [Planctomycetes bacterium]|nr:hypothetical protein [Planctomycetota bacterium]